MRQESTHHQIGRAVNEGWVHGGSFFGSLLSGTLLGYFADRWLGTEPWLVVTGIILGSYAGFVRMWHYSKQMDDDARGR